ncbi:hypothetical protein BD779DRAFT_1473129 [Infundibulicybe gibba]|nr:hypothetical protein BD779DRAFT_1473129 [Infundibulicybe gibba]
MKPSLVLPLTLLLDFVWAQSVPREDLRRPVSAEDGELITAEHDMRMQKSASILWVLGYRVIDSPRKIWGRGQVAGCIITVEERCTPTSDQIRRFDGYDLPFWGIWYSPYLLFSWVRSAVLADMICRLGGYGVYAPDLLFWRIWYIWCVHTRSAVWADMVYTHQICCFGGYDLPFGRIWCIRTIYAVFTDMYCRSSQYIASMKIFPALMHDALT